MMAWWKADHSRKQTVANSYIGGSVFLISNEGDVDIRTGDSLDSYALDTPGVISISPPTDQVGRPMHGRDSLVADLVHCTVERTSTDTVHVLCGLGGCGKSTVAMILAREAAKQGIDVWWITATAIESLHAGMRQLTATLGVHPQRLRRAWSGEESAVDLLWDLLARREKKWLLIVDGIDDPGLLAAAGSTVSDGNGWIRPPLASHGSIVATTRDADPSAWANWCEFWQVGMLAPAEGAAVLIDYAGKKAGDSQDAADLARRLGGLPLALRLAGTYLAANLRMPLPGAIRTYREYSVALEGSRIQELYPELEQDTGIPDRQARDLIGRTWELSLAMLAARGFSEARPLLQLLSHFADAPIPYTFLYSDILEAYNFIESASDVRLREVVRALTNLGLVELRVEPQRQYGNSVTEVDLTLHPLVRDVGRYSSHLSRPKIAYLYTAIAMAERAAESLGRPDDWKTWPSWQALTIHSFHLLDEVGKEPGVDANAVVAMTYSAYRSGQFLMSRAEYDRAAFQQQRVLDALIKACGENHPNTLTIRLELAVNAARRGLLVEAETELGVLKLRKAEVFGEESVEALASCHAHADVLWQQGLLPAAEAEYKSILAVYAKRGRYGRAAFGTSHNLAQVLLERGKLAEAETIIETITSEVQEDEIDDVDLLQARFVLARVRHSQARYDEAIAEMRDLIDALGTTIGEDHPITLAMRHELGVVLQESGSPEEASAILRAVLVVRMRFSGSDHLDTLSTRHQLALALQDAGELGEARSHYLATLKKRTKVLGDSHPHTLATRFQIAVLLQQSGHIAEAKREFTSVLQAEAGSLGWNHPNTLITRFRLVSFRLRDRQFTEALNDFEEILAIQRSIHGPGHPVTRHTEDAIREVKEHLKFLPDP